MNFILVGNNANITPAINPIRNIQAIPENIKLPDSMIRPNTSSPHQLDGTRTISQVSILPDTQLTPVLHGAAYNKVSVMSLDGIFSPVSFYPTPYNTTYGMVPYSRSKCPYCNGAGRYTTFITDFTSVPLLGPVPIGRETIANYKNAFLNSIFPGRTLDNRECKFCVPDSDKAIKRNKSAIPSETTPPYLIGSGTDLEIIDNRANLFAGTNNVINKFTLNPLIMLNGEFANSGAKQTDDNCTHNVGVVGFGMNVPREAGSICSTRSLEMNKNFTENDIDYTDGLRQNNQRFFGLRGPLIVHGWGYDKEGYPVPNSSGEYKYTAEGEIVRDGSGNAIFKNQQLLENGEYSAPYKEKTFYKGWAALPNTWPVGPVDLRWDEDAEIWTVGSPYKPVWITIEHDLVDHNPVRGVIEDGMTDSTPLPEGLRKVVFVKDSSLLFRSPREAALYCKYNPDNGFYEPIYNRPFVAIGTIINSQQASIEKAYTIKAARDSALGITTIESYMTLYDNPLRFSISSNTRGIFNFINGKWTLTSIND